MHRGAVAQAEVQCILSTVVSTDAGAPLAEQISSLQFDGCTTVPFRLNGTLSLFPVKN